MYFIIFSMSYLRERLEHMNNFFFYEAQYKSIFGLSYATYYLRHTCCIKYTTNDWLRIKYHKNFIWSRKFVDLIGSKCLSYYNVFLKKYYLELCLRLAVSSNSNSHQSPSCSLSHYTKQETRVKYTRRFKQVTTKRAS